MLKTPFYNGIIAKSNILFGTLFNEITIERQGENGHVQSIRVPLSYGPREKFLARLEGDKDLEKNLAITLPRMSFSLMSMDYDNQRQLNPTHKINQQFSPTEKTSVFQPVPYNLEYQLSIMTKTDEDAAKIIEQILPFFTPEFTVTAELLDDMPGVSFDIPIIRTGISRDDAYEGDFQTRRVLIHTLDFTMKTWFFGPVKPRKIIKFVKVNMYSDKSDDAYQETLTARPGLTIDGKPTTYLSEDVIQAVGTPVIENGRIVDIAISNNIGYGSATITIDPPSDPNGIQAIAEPIIVQDKIVGVNMISQGEGYLTTPSIVISPPDLVSISYFDINPDDNYAYIVRVEDNV